MRIGVLALQGAFAEHIERLKELGATCFEIRKLTDLDGKIDGLVFPGGESTAMRKLLHELGLFKPILKLLESGIPVFGTCAGMILLAKNLGGEAPVFGTLDITVKRNAYGRQLGSFRCIDTFDGKNIEMPFIRAPFAKEVGEGVTVLSTHDNKIVAVRERNQLATAFHPELTNDSTVYKYYLEMVANPT